MDIFRKKWSGFKCDRWITTRTADKGTWRYDAARPHPRRGLRSPRVTTRLCIWHQPPAGMTASPETNKTLWYLCTKYEHILLCWYKTISQWGSPVPWVLRTSMLINWCCSDLVFWGSSLLQRCGQMNTLLLSTNWNLAGWETLFTLPRFTKTAIWRHDLHAMQTSPLSVTGVSHKFNTCSFCRCSDNSWRPVSPNWKYHEKNFYSENDCSFSLPQMMRWHTIFEGVNTFTRFLTGDQGNKGTEPA